MALASAANVRGHRLRFELFEMSVYFDVVEQPDPERIVDIRDASNF